MPLPRYEVTLPPDALRHASAFTPVVSATTAVWSAAQAQGWTVAGHPGTQAIPAPRADVGPSARPGSALPAGPGGGTRYMPARWYPNLYYARQRMWGAIGGVRIFSDNQLPIPTRPAADPRWVPPLTKRRQQWLAGRQLGSGPVLTRWPQWHG